MQKVILFGELMLRLKPPLKERLLQSPYFEASFGGSEANVAVSISNYVKTAPANPLTNPPLSPVFISALPSSPLGDSAVSTLQYHGVTTLAVRKKARMGLYFLEEGSGVRPSKVIYDRENSAFSTTRPSEYAWEEIFDNAALLHISGVTCALNLNTLECVRAAIAEAKKKKVKISVDLNYRGMLWKYGKSAKEVMPDIVKEANILIGNEEDVQHSLGLTLNKPMIDANIELTHANYIALSRLVKNTYPNLEVVSLTIRNSFSAERNKWSAILNGKTRCYSSIEYTLNDITERVGAGDAFSGALLYSLLTKMSEKEALDFATASAALKHTIAGDFNLASYDETMALVNGNTQGRIVR